jgi:KDO2-lipid IV(A) lauroyltransferase
MRKIRYFIEYIFLRVALFLLDRISAQSARSFAVHCADFWYMINVSRRRLTQNNVLLSGIAKDRKKADGIAKASYRHFATLIVESIKSDETFDENNWQKNVEMDVDPEAMELFKKPGKGCILVSGHIGNWEVAAQLLSFIKPVVGITKHMNNPYADKLMKQRKPRYQFRPTPKRDTDKARFLTAIKNGEILALLIDQHAVKGTKINFFNKPVSSHRSPALLHLVSGAPLCFGYCLRKGPMSYKFVAQKPLIYKATGDRDKDVCAILNTLTEKLEDVIRQNPEQYLWAHRRWR